MLALGAAFSVIDSHTAGHPTRVILSGIEPLKGGSVADMRDDFKARFDHLRPTLLHEPRGHAAMVGLVPVASTVADYGAFFISSYVYLDMCGHGTIGYAKTLAYTGQLSPAKGDRFTLETPAGVVTVRLTWNPDGSLGAVRLANVPSFIGETDLHLSVEGLGEIRLDLVYSGMWYALVDAAALGLTLTPEAVTGLLAIGWRIKSALKGALKGSQLIGDLPMPSVLFIQDLDRHRAIHFLVLEPNKFDRSPCGTGTAARMTSLIDRGILAAGDIYTAQNILGISFSARLAERTQVGGRDAAVIDIEGQAYITSSSTLFVEQEDPLAKGFLCR
jgi:proline racemase